MTTPSTPSFLVCAHCEVPIVDPTSQVIHGIMAFCCANCAAAMEAGGSGSDPHTLEASGDLRCAHCSVPIVSDASMVMRNGLTYCCSNCETAMSTGSRAA